MLHIYINFNTAYAYVQNGVSIVGEEMREVSGNFVQRIGLAFGGWERK